MGLNPAWLVSLEELWTHRDTKGTRAQGKGHVRTQQESGHLQAKEGGLRRNQPCWHFDLVLLAPRTEFSSVTQSCPTLCDPMNSSVPGILVHHQLLESTQTHVHWGGDAVQPSYPLLTPSPPALNLSQHQGLLKWVSPSYQVAKVLEFQLQHQSFQLTPRIDLL